MWTSANLPNSLNNKIFGFSDKIEGGKKQEKKKGRTDWKELLNFLALAAIL